MARDDVVSLEDFLSASVPASIRARGEDLRARGRVLVEDGNEESARARVEGDHDVQRTALRLSDGELRFSCSCPDVRDERPCKHVWGLVLEAADAGLLRAALRRPNLRLVAGESEPVAASPVDESSAGDVAADGWMGRLAAVRRALSSPAAPALPWRGGRTFLYVLDLLASHADGAVVVEVLWRERHGAGEFSRPRRWEPKRDAIELVGDERDRRILAALMGSAGESLWIPVEDGRGIFRLDEPAQELLLPLLAATGRFHPRESEDVDLERVLRLDEAGPWDLRLRLDRAADLRDFRLHGALRRGDDEVPLDGLRLATPAGYLLLDDTFHRARDPQNAAWAAAVASEPVMVPPRDVGRFLEELYGAPAVPHVDLPPEVPVEVRRAVPLPRLRLIGRRERGRRVAVPAVLAFQYDEWIVERAAPSSGRYDAGRGALLLRDAAREEAAVRRLVALGAAESWDPEDRRRRYLVPAERVPGLVRTLAAEGWWVEADGRLYRSPSTVALEVTSGIDWFDVRGDVRFDRAAASLPDVLRALRGGEGAVRLDDGTYGLLPEHWLKRYGLLGQLGETRRDVLRFHGNQVGILDLLLADLDAEVHADEAFARARARLHRFAGVTPRDPEGEFTGTLRSYQRDGLGWLWFLHEFGLGGCLADDMGLGKTVQVLALLESLRARGGARASLVVVPRSLVFNWRREAERFTPRLRVVEHTGADRSRDPVAFDTADVVLTTYGTLVRDVVWLRERRFEYVVLDEAQAMKNPRTKTAKACRLLQADHRLALSGTPIENHLGELWSLFEFLNPGMLGRSTAFAGAAAKLRDPDEETLELLSRALRPFLLRRTKDQVAPELPEKTEQTVACALGRDERRLYDELREHYRTALLSRVEAEGLERSRMHVLEALLRLRQAACHPGLIDPARAALPSAKLEELVSRLHEVVDEGHKALVFSQFTRFLAIVRRRLEAEGIVHEYLDGKTQDRGARVERFQEDAACPVFLVSLKAGGHGLNLTAADYVFLLDPWWNPAVEAQAIDRTHRIGQARAVFAYRLIGRDTVEEKVLELQEKKRHLAEAVLTAETGPLAALTRQDLEELLS